MDYQGNSDKGKKKDRPEKKIETVVTGEVVVAKKPLMRRIKDTISEADFKSVVGYIFTDILIPAAKNMIVESAAKGAERLMYPKEDPRYRRSGNPYGRISYQSPVQRGIPYQSAPPRELGPRSNRITRDDYILDNRAEAELTLERMNDLMDSFNEVSVADLKELLNLAVTPVDNKWGWLSLVGARVIDVREGYLLDLPPIQPI